MSEIILGPVLGYEWDDSHQTAYYTVIIRTAAKNPAWEINGNSVAMTDLSGLLHDQTRIWRGEIELAGFQEKTDTRIAYQILSKGNHLSGRSLGPKSPKP